MTKGNITTARAKLTALLRDSAAKGGKAILMHTERPDRTVIHAVIDMDWFAAGVLEEFGGSEQ